MNNDDEVEKMISRLGDDELMLFMERYLLDEFHIGHSAEKFNWVNDTVYISSYMMWIIPSRVKGFLDIPKASDENIEKALRLMRHIPDWEEFYRIDITDKRAEVNVCHNAVKYKSIDFDVWIDEENVKAFCGEIGNKNYGWFQYSFYTTNPEGPIYVFNEDKELRGIMMPLSKEFSEKAVKNGI